MDGFLGTVEIDPDAETRAFFAARRKRIEEEDRSLLLIQDQPAVTRDGHAVDLGANLELPGEVERALSVGAGERRAVPHRVLLPRTGSSCPRRRSSTRPTATWSSA